jgi:hypothetical protein
MTQITWLGIDPGISRRLSGLPLKIGYMIFKNVFTYNEKSSLLNSEEQV